MGEIGGGLPCGPKFTPWRHMARKMSEGDVRVGLVEVVGAVGAGSIELGDFGLNWDIVEVGVCVRELKV